MIKLLHLADLHIGIENYGRIEPTSGMHTRLIDYLDRLDEAIAIGLDAGVHLVIIAGDIYKNRTPNPTHQREFARRILRLVQENVPVFILTGNHDISPAYGRAHSVEIFHALNIPGVTIADRPDTHCIDTRAGPVQLIALPWVTRHSLLTREDMRAKSFVEIDRELHIRIERFIDRAIADLTADIPAVLALHATIDGAQLGAERVMTLGQDLVLPRSMIADPRLNYVAMGHIHRHQSLGEHPPMVYAGSIERVDFGERNEHKGCVLVELAPTETRWQFQRLNARPFVSIAVDTRQASDPQQAIAAAIARHDVRAAAVRVDITTTREQAPSIDESALHQQLEAAGAFVIAAITTTVERTARQRLAGAEQELLHGLSPRRALELYLQARNTDPERIAALLAAADELLAAERPSQ